MSPTSISCFGYWINNLTLCSKIALLVIFLLLLIIGIFYSNSFDVAEKQESETNPVMLAENTKAKQSSDVVESAPLPQSSKAQRIEELQAKADALYKATFENGDITKKRQYHYEDDWCVARADLKENEFHHFQNELKEWLLQRGHVYLRTHPEDPPLNNEFIESYQELDEETLTQLAQNDDQMALITLAKRSDISDSIQRKSARRLVVLGDTSTGLNILVHRELHEAAASFEPDSQDFSKSKRHLINAMTLVEYGLMRLDTRALFTFLYYAEDHQSRLNGMAVDEILNDKDFSEISKRANAFYDWLNKKRLSQSLPSFEMEQGSKAAEIHYKEQLSYAYTNYGKILNASWWSADWKNKYLAKDACVSRLLAREKFMNEQFPAIKEEIKKLQQQDN